MATTQLSDAYVYPVYQSYSALNGVETTNFYRAGIIRRTAQLDAIARGAGKVTEMPFWLDLDASGEPDYTNDDPADFAVPAKITSANMVARKAFVHKAFSTMDLTEELTRANPMEHIRNRFGVYWERQASKRTIAIVQGIIADNIANDSSDMGLDISAEVGDAAIFNSDAFTDASYTMGELTGGMTAIAVHSKVMARMSKNDDIVMVPDSEGKLIIPTYKGVRVVMDDKMPKTGSGDDTIYTSVMFGAGAFGFGGVEGQLMGLGEGVPVNPSYVEREELAGAGGGMEVIGERKTWLLHPFGFSYTATDGNLTELSPTLADLSAATYWNRVVDRRNVPMAWIKSKA